MMDRSYGGCAGRVEQDSQQVFLDISLLPRITFHAIEHVLDVQIVDFRKPLPHQRGGLFTSRDDHCAVCGAHGFDHNVHDLMSSWALPRAWPLTHHPSK